jgi:gnd: 6-phosphogluconate dehydrogenase, decarboxylating
MMMVRAGSPVDELMDQLFPLLSPGDILIDGGNSNYEDTNRRVQLAESKGFLSSVAVCPVVKREP